MLKSLTKTLIYIVSLAVVSITGSMAINLAIAAWSEPSLAPPNGNINAVVFNWDSPNFGSIVATSTMTTATTNAKFYIDSYTGYQVRLDSNADDTNAEFTINNGANQEIFKIDENGLITAKSDYTPASAQDLATKAYVDAAGGGATLDNQLSIMGELYSSTTASLMQIKTAIDDIPVSVGDATYAKQTEISGLLQIQNGWVAAGTYYSTGGNTNFCRSNVVDASGTVIVNNINAGSICDNSGGATWRCSSGQCGKTLTWSGSVKTELDCTNASGTVFDGGSGTACKFTGSGLSCPAGWTQAADWQRYSSTGGDICGDYNSDVPTTFANQSSTVKSQGSSDGLPYSECGNDACVGHPDGAWRNNQLHGSCLYNRWQAKRYAVVITTNGSTYRSEIGCY